MAAQGFGFGAVVIFSEGLRIGRDSLEVFAFGIL